MIKKAKLKFNTSGPNIPGKHYTLRRESLVAKGIELVKDDRYFTIWAPRQSGKSTYFQMMAQQLQEEEYRVVQLNFENYEEAPRSALFTYLARETGENWGVGICTRKIPGSYSIKK